MPYSLLLSLVACSLQSAPEINRDQLSQWIDDAVTETITHAKAENTDRALEAWTAAQVHFESKMEPALRYYVTDQRKVTSLEYKLGRVRDFVNDGEYAKAEVHAYEFLADLENAATVIPQIHTEALTH